MHNPSSEHGARKYTPTVRIYAPGPWPFFPAPGNDGWADAFDSPNLVARFNDTHSTFDTSSKYLTAVKAKLQAKYDGFEHSFTAVIAAAAADGSTGGYGVLTGVRVDNLR